MRALLILAVITIASAGEHKELHEKYGMKKIFESCFGKDLLLKKLHKFYQSVASCKNESAIKAPLRKGFDWGAVFQNNANKVPLYLPVPEVTHGYQSPFAFNNREKRHIFFNEDKLRKLKNKFLEKVKLSACILQRMNILDTALTVQWNEVERQYTEPNLEAELTADLLQVFRKCKNKVSCLSMDQKDLGTFPVGLKQAMYYFKCEKKYKVEACMKKDFRAHANMFELDGLDGLLDHFEDNDDKMLKVMKIFHKFGDDDMDLFD